MSVAVSLAVLIYCSSLLIGVAEYFSYRNNWSPALTGVILLGFGTSFPEAVVSFFSALNQTPLIAYGNAVGSNLANIGLILGVALCFAPLHIKANETNVQFLLLFASFVVLMIFAYDTIFSQLEAVIALVLFVMAMLLLYLYRHRDEPQDREDGANAPSTKNYKLTTALVIFFISLVGIAIAGRLTIISAEALAVSLEVSQRLIGILILAIGTSMPEFVVCMLLIRKKQTGMIIGNILGSNIFNTLLVLPIAHLLMSFSVVQEDIYRDLGFLFVLTALLIVCGFSWRSAESVAQQSKSSSISAKRVMHRKSAAAFVISYILYIYLVV